VSEDLKKGDHVAWKTSQGETTGTVVKKQTSPTKIKGHEAKASQSDPQVIVERSKSGAKAAHKPTALKKKSQARWPTKQGLTYFSRWRFAPPSWPETAF